MRNIFEIAKFTFLDNLKRHNFIILFIYILVVMGSGVLFSILSPMQEIRVIMDMGIAAIEIFTFLSCSFLAVRIILQEMEEKTVYLILSRPLTRASYIIGRFLGISSVIFSYIIIMGASLTLMLLAKGWDANLYIVYICWSIFCKVLIVAAFSILLSLISTSSASSFISIFFIWTLGHFTEEFKYINMLLKEADSKTSYFIDFVYIILPNFSKLNFKDMFHTVTFSMDLFWITTYAFGYSAVLLLISILIFNKKEL